MLDTMAELALLALFIGLSAFFSACETAFLSMTRIRLHGLLEKREPGSESLLRLRSNRRRVVIALLIGNNIANIAASAIATAVSLSLFGEQGLGIAIGVMSFIMLTFGDIAPKSFATNYGEKVTLTFAPLLEAYYWIATPLVLIFEVINRMIPGVYSRATVIERFTEDEVRTAVKLGAAHKSISELEREIIENVLSFNDQIVADVMTPKARVMCFPADAKSGAALTKAIHSLYYRFPVTKGGEVIGTVNIRALAKSAVKNPEQRLEQMLLTPLMVRSTDKLNEAFSHLQANNRHFSIVVDPQGRFVGVLTMDDLLEELVGKVKIV